MANLKGPMDVIYRDLINAIDAEPIPFWQAEESRARQDTRYVCIRHDVDHDMLKALDMGKHEFSFPVPATYFLLHTAPYFRPEDPGFKMMLNLLKQFGHWFGLHHNAILASIPGDALQAAVSFLKKRESSLYASAHGDKGVKAKGLKNWMIWDNWEFLSTYSPLASELSLNMESLGIENEVYFMEWDYCWSDSGRKWHGGPAPKPPFFEFEQPLFGNRDELFASIDEFNHLDYGVAMLLCHPCWWHKC